MTLARPLPIESLLAEADWVTGLARALVADAATADDVAQSTWADVLRSPPRQAVDPRAWLAAIVRRKAQRARRTEARRHRREQVAAAARRDAVAPSAAELAARVATHRELVDAVLALDEPYRETVVLRFFEGLDLEAIGERTASVHNTVRSRLQRGLQQLRRRLDHSHGGRERWLPAVLVLSRRRLAGELAGGGVATGIALAITMKKIVLGAAALAAGLLLALPYLSSPAATAVPSPPPGEVVAAAASTGTPGTVAGAAAAGEVLQRNAAPAASPAIASAPRRLVDREGQPLAGVVLRAESPFAVRWQGGDRGWISGPDRSLRVPALDEERLRTDPAFAQSFFAGFAQPDEWRAAILGTPLPERETRSGSDGAFGFDPAVAATDGTITVADPGFVLVAAGQLGGRPWIAGPAARVSGTVRDEDGKPLADTFVLALCPTAEGAIALPAQQEARTDDDGRYLVRRALANGLLRVGHEGYETAFVPVLADPVQQLDVVLRRRTASERRQLDGTVVDSGGRPIEGASVWFGRQQTRTGADGRFALAADDPRPQYALTIAATGWALLQYDDFGAALGMPGTATSDLLFVLGQKPLAARGVVIGSDGAPLAGALVGLVDPTLLDLSFEGIEARIGGWSGGVQTAADGTFALGGLGSRSYRLRAIDPATGAVVTSGPVRAEAGDVVLRLPRDLRREVRGVVLASGQGLAGATVEVAFCTHITKGGGTQFDSAPAVPCDAAGRFVLPALPRQGAWLGVRVAGALRTMVPVEALPASGEVTVECGNGRWLQLVGSAFPTARTIHFELGSGRCVAAETGTGPALLAADGGAPTLPIPDGATAVVIDHGRQHSRRLELTEDQAVHLRVR